MDETQKKKLYAKQFLQRNKTIGFSALAFFVSLFVMYFAFVYFYNQNQTPTTNEVVQTQTNESFIGNLLPVFESRQTPDIDLDPVLLGNFNSNSSGEAGEEDRTKLLQIENRPVLGYAVFDKPITIKNYIKNKPKICAEKIEPILKKEEKSAAVLNFQNTLRNIETYEDTPITGVLDEQTREKIFVFQTRYADILYKNKTSKTPTRLVDKETAHFLNLLCNLENENKDDFVQVPTIRYVLKETREIFDYNTESKEKKGVDAKIATGTQEMVLSDKGDFAVFRKDVGGVIDSIFYNIRTKSITHLENNISTLDFNSKDILVYGVPGYDGLTIKKYNYLENKVQKVATIPLNEWTVRFMSDTELAIVSKPAASADGIFMSLNLTDNKLRQLAGPLAGLSFQETNSPEYSILSLGQVGTSKALLLNNKTRNIGDLGINTFAEKCSQTIFSGGIFCAVPKTLNQNMIYPDDWYKGKTLTEDILVFKSLTGTTTRPISYLENRPVSVVNLQVTKNGIFFIDENLFALYSLEL